MDQAVREEEQVKQLELLSEKLSGSIKQRIKAVHALRERAQAVRSASEYQTFLDLIVPLLLRMLNETKPVFTRGTAQDLRNGILDVLSVLPVSLKMEPVASSLMEMVLGILVHDNEENALTALRITADLHKTFQQQLSPAVPSFIQFVANLYASLRTSITANFSSSTGKNEIQKSTTSFKVLANCPVNVSFMFQVHQLHLQTLLPALLNPMLASLKIPVSAPDSSKKIEFQDFLDIQIKTLSFMHSVLRTQKAELLKPHEDDIASAAMGLLSITPPDALSCRMELFMVIRLLLKTEIRSSFFNHIEEFLDERILIGSESSDICKPHAYVVLGDLVKLMKGSFNANQLTRLVHLFARNIQDSSLPLTVQSLSVRRLSDLVDNIYSLNEIDKEKGYARALLARILCTFVDKFETLKDIIPDLAEKVISAKSEDPSDPIDRSWKLTSTLKNREEFPEVTVQEIHQIMTQMIQGLKTVVWCLSNSRISRSQPAAHALRSVESEVVAKFFDFTLECFQLYHKLPQLIPQQPLATSAASTDSRPLNSKQDPRKEIFELFSDVFTALDTGSFRCVFGRRLPLLFKFMLEFDKLPLIVLPRHFLANAHVSKTFADILLIFLISKMKDGTLDTENPSSLLISNLFNILIRSLTLYAEIEGILRPYLRPIVELFMDKITSSENPMLYLHLLRHLFRWIKGGRFELLYQELLPIPIERMLRCLLEFRETCREPSKEADLASELCLTIPASINTLSHVMSLMMKAVLGSLKSQNDHIVKLGLRNLDLWLGQVMHEYLYECMRPILSDLMRTLCSLLIPYPSNLGFTAARILGKLGGRNRRFLVDGIMLPKPVLPSALFTFNLSFSENEPFSMELTPLIEHISSRIEGTRNDSWVKNSFEVLRVSLVSFASVHAQVAYSGTEKYDPTQESYRVEQREKLAVTLLESLFSFKGKDVVKEQFKEFLNDLTEHIAGLCKEFESDLKEYRFVHFFELAFIDRLIMNISSTDCEMFEKFLIAADLENAPKLADLLCTKLTAYCYEKDISKQEPGICGIHVLCEKLGSDWTSANYYQLIRALIFTFRDVSDSKSPKLMQKCDQVLSVILHNYLETDDDLDQRLRNIVFVLCPELPSLDKPVRETVQKLFNIVSEITETPLSEILEPYIEKLLSPLLSSTSSSLSIGKIGFISATTFCLELEPSLIDIDDSVANLFKLAVKTVLKEETSEVAYHSSSSGRHLAFQSKQLRIESLRLISAALLRTGEEQKELRDQMILALFRKLTSLSPDVVSAAKDGLKAIIARENLPKELLQDGLNPILQNLMHAHKLSNHVLKLLEHLLELLSSCFNDILGERLLHHLHFYSEALKKVLEEQFAIQGKDTTTRSKYRDFQHEVKIPIAILQLFHLLPPAPRQFMTKLVMNVINFETILPRVKTYGESCVGASSPFREPLVQFLNKYASEAVAFFLTPKNLADRSLSQLLLSILQANSGEPIREALMFMYDQLAAATFNIDKSNKQIPKEASEELQLQGILIVHALAMRNPDWLASTRKIVGCLLVCWRDHPQSVAQEITQPHEHVQKWKLIAECLMVFCARNKSNVGILWTLLPAFVHRTLVDYSFLQKYFQVEIAQNSSVDEKCDILKEFFSGVLNSKLVPVLKVKGLRYVIQPILEDIWEKGLASQVFSEDLLDTMLHNVLEETNRSRLSQIVLDELLEVYASMIKHGSDILGDSVETVFEFAISFIDSESHMPSKTEIVACYTLSTIVTTFDTFVVPLPEMFEKCLSCYTSEASSLVDASLDLMVSLLVQSDASRVVDMVCKALQSRIIGHQIHLWNLIMRNSDSFYPFRQTLLTPLFHCLQRLGIPERPLPHKKLALNLIRYLVKWDKKAAEQTDERFNATTLENVQNFLIKMCLVTCEDALQISKQCMLQLGACLETWNEKPASLSVISRECQKRSNLSPAFLSTSLSLIVLLYDTMSSAFFLTNVHHFQVILQSLLKSQHPLSLRSNFTKLIAKLNDTFAYPSSEPLIQQLYVNLFTMIRGHLAIQKDHVMSLLVMFGFPPSFSAALFQEGIAAVSMLSKEYTSLLVKQKKTAAVDEKRKIAVKETILKGLDWFGVLQSNMTEKKEILSVFSLLLSVIEDSSILQKIIQFSQDWLAEDILSTEEKVQLISKITRWYSSDPSLIDSFLIAAHPFLQSSWSSMEAVLKPNLQTMFVVGLRSKHTKVRQLYQELLYDLSGETWKQKLFFLLSPGEWIYFKGHLWMSCAVEVILKSLTDTIELDQSIFPSVSVSKSNAFMDKHSLSTKSFLDTLCELQHMDYEVTSILWSSMFLSCWKLLSHTDRSQLQRQMNALLVQESSQKNANPKSSIVKTLVSSTNLIASRELPPLEIDPTILSFAASDGSSWYASLLSLERSLHDSQIVSAMSYILEVLNETDDLAGFRQLHAKSSFAKAAIALSQFGLWPRAQTMYLKALEDASDQSQNELWEQEWIKCAKHLNQWKELFEYSTKAVMPEVALECAFRMGDWQSMRKLLQIIDVDSSVDACLHHAFHMVQRVPSQEKKTLEGFPQLRAIVDKSVQMALLEWSNLPTCISVAHVPALQRFHGLVELQESVGILNSILKSCTGQPAMVPDLSPHLIIWRDRLPNEWESIPSWSSVLSWRSHVFQIVAQVVLNLVPSSSLTLKNERKLHDTCWNVIKFAEIARKQQLPIVSLNALSNISKLPSMGSEDRFRKLKEHVQVCMSTPNEFAAAVDIVNQSDLDEFNDQQKSELLCLKGVALEEMRLGEDSNTAFSTCVSINESYAEGWLKWAGLLDQVFSIKRDLEWAENALTCYLQAARHTKEPHTRLMLSRALWLLSFDKEEHMQLNAIFDRYAEHIPAWMWVLWIPQLLSSLSRLEGPALQRVLLSVAKTHPQALYYQLRAYFHEKRERVERNEASEESAMSFRMAKELLQALKSEKPSLVSELEKMLDELSRRFQPEPEEELLGGIRALFNRCFKQTASIDNHISKDLKETISKISRKFFQIPEPMSKKQKLVDFVTLYRKDFLNDFDPSSSNFPSSIPDLLDRLRLWQNRLEKQLFSSCNQCICLETLSPFLMRFRGYGIEIPGQYVSDEKFGENERAMSPYTLEAFLPSVRIVQVHGNYYRSVSMIGSDGKVHQFAVHYAVTHLTKSDEKLMQLLVILNRIMKECKESRERNLNFEKPLVVPLANRLRLLKIDPDFISLGRMYKQSCELSNIDPALTPVAYRDALVNASAWDVPSSVDKSELDAFRNRRTKVFSEFMTVKHPGIQNILSNYITSTCQSDEDLWLFRKEFGKHLALTGLLSYAFKVGDRSLHRIAVSRRSGRVVPSQFYPQYNSKGHIECNEPVPFRLSPNLVSFLGPIVSNGSVSGALIGLAACVLKHQDILKNFLYLYLRDDMLSWNLDHNPELLMNDSKVQSLESQLRANIQQNTLRILVRVQKVMSWSSEDNPTPDSPVPIDRQAKRLIQQASDMNNLSMMSPTWHPWF